MFMGLGQSVILASTEVRVCVCGWVAGSVSVMFVSTDECVCVCVCVCERGVGGWHGGKGGFMLLCRIHSLRHGSHRSLTCTSPDM